MNTLSAQSPASPSAPASGAKSSKLDAQQSLGFWFSAVGLAVGLIVLLAVSVIG